MFVANLAVGAARLCTCELHKSELNVTPLAEFGSTNKFDTASAVDLYMIEERLQQGMLSPPRVLVKGGI